MAKTDTQCKYYKKCGGCQLQNMTYPEQLAYKQRMVNSLLSKYGRVNKIIGMENPYHYRNKVQAAFGWDYKRKRCISGVYQSNSHRIVAVDSCMIEDQKADEIIVSVRKLADAFKIKPYDEDRNVGFLRHVLVKRGFSTNEIMVVIVSSNPVFPSRNHFVKALLKQHPQITTIVHNINPFQTNLVLGQQNKILYGKGYIEDILCGCVFRISPSSFYQINPVQTEVLYRTAIDYAKLTGKETLFDSYCGTGTIGIIAAKSAKQVLGVELNRDAVKDAISNAKRNQIKNIYFECGDAGKFLTEITKAKEKFNVVMMDPPRAGSSIEFLKSVTTMKPDRIVYISCNPVTLARDLGYITTHGYRAEKIQPVDMFPFTRHVETVVLLSRKVI